jgi:hypothetical protein
VFTASDPTLPATYWGIVNLPAKSEQGGRADHLVSESRRGRGRSMNYPLCIFLHGE